MLIWQRMTGTVLWWASRWLGQFSFGIQCSYWFRSVLTRVWWTSKNHKHANKTKHTRNETWASCVIIQSVSSKKVPASFISSKYAWDTHECGICLTLFSIYCMKRNSQFYFLFWQTKACQSMHISAQGSAHKYKRWYWSHNITSRWTTPSRKPICEEKHDKSLCGNLRAALKFQPFAHAG